MLLSHRVIKSGNMVVDTTTADIQTELKVQHIIETIQNTNPDRDAYHEEKLEMARFLKEAEEEKRAIVEAAKQDALEARKQAEAEGFRAGEIQGQEMGFQSGYQTGLEAAQVEAEKLKQAAHEMMSMASQEVNAFYTAKREEIIALAAQMAEKVIHEKINTSDEKIIALLEPILSRMVQESKFITLTVTPELQNFTKEKLKDLEKTFPLYRFAVLVDSSLEENGCIIETSHAIVDLQVKQQLDAMVEELSEMMVS